MTRIATTHRRRTRPGFTLVELMVAAAVCVIIMAILATCFSSGIDTLRQLRSQGDLTDQLRAAEVVIKRDLQAKRFLAEDDKENLGVRLSDLRYDLLNYGGAVVVKDPNYNYAIRPPRGGFMRIKSSDASTVSQFVGTYYEGTDQDGLSSTTSTDHYLHFTSILSGGIDQNVYTATVDGVVPVSPANPTGAAAFTSAAAEIALFLDTGTGPSGFAGSIPLYNLIRRQRLVALTDSDSFNFPGPANPSAPGVISTSVATGRVNTMADLTNPNNRLSGPLGGVATTTPQARNIDAFLAPLAGNRIGDDVLLSNVISFEVKVSFEPAKYGFPAIGLPHPTNVPLPPWIAPRAFPGTLPPSNDNDNDGVSGAATAPALDANTDYPFDYLPGRPYGVPAGSNNLTGGFNSLLNNTPNGRYVYDSWSMAFPGWNSAAMAAAPGPATPPAPNTDAIPMRVRVKSIQIRVRVYDPKMKNARQMSIVQDV